MTKHKILCGGRRESLCEILQFNLSRGLLQSIRRTAPNRPRHAPERYSLILLDVAVGEMGGFEWPGCSGAKRPPIMQPKTPRRPIADSTSLQAFLRARQIRVRSVRRTAPEASGTEQGDRVQGLHMDLVRKICTVDGTPLALTKGFEILPAAFEPRIFSRERYCIRSGRRGDRAGPHHRRQYHAAAPQNRRLRRPHRNIGLWYGFEE